MMLAPTASQPGRLLLAHNALQRPKGLTAEQIAGWLLFGIAFAPGLAGSVVRTNGWRWIYDGLRGADYEGALTLAGRLRRIAPQVSMVRYMRKDLSDSLARGGSLRILLRPSRGAGAPESGAAARPGSGIARWN